jgi:predicted sulfurtransferase
MMRTNDCVSIFQATLAETNQNTPEITTEELRNIITDRSAIILDTHTSAEFDAGHIPGARKQAHDQCILDLQAFRAKVEQRMSGDLQDLF